MEILTDDEIKTVQKHWFDGPSVDDMKLCRAIESALLAKLAGEAVGWKLVPVEPTKAMRRVGADVWSKVGGSFTQVTGAMYRAMLAVAPTHPQATEPEPSTAVEPVTDAMVDAYLTAQRQTVEEADRFGRPNIGGLHTNTVREACRNGITAALTQSQAAPARVVPDGYVLVPNTPSNEMTSAMADALEDPENERSSWDLAENMYRAMLAAAPQQKGGAA